MQPHSLLLTLPPSPEIQARVQALHAFCAKYGSQKDCAKALGVSPSTLSRALDPEQATDRRLAPIEGRIAKLQQGQKDSGPGEPPAVSPSTQREHPPEPVLSELVRIQHVSVEASAGDGSEVDFEEVNGETFLPAWYVWQEFGVSPERVKRIRVHGDSMKGTVEAGQLVYVVLLEPGQQPVHGGVYVIRGPHGLLIKRLYFDDESTVSEAGEIVRRRYVRIHSDNPDAGTYRVPLEVFQRDYTPIAHFRRVEAYI